MDIYVWICENEIEIAERENTQKPIKQTTKVYILNYFVS